MKRIILLILLAAPCMCCAQENSRTAQISLIPYIADKSEIKGEAREYLLDKLSQMATVGGLSGEGVDDRFIITANVRVLKKTLTATLPQKTAMRLSVSIYIGDGISGTLYASANKEVTGMGSDDTDAYISAMRKLPIRDPSFLKCVEEGKQRIIEYYDQTAEGIIKNARAEAASGNYQSAVSQLFSIPMQCRSYSAAQELIAKLSERDIDSRNQELLASARAAWGASPNAEGAQRSREILDEIKLPSSIVSSAVRQLSTQMSSRLSEIDRQAWKKEMSAMQKEHETEKAHIESQKQRSIAYINAAASVARAYVANRPKVVYRIYHWW